MALISLAPAAFFQEAYLAVTDFGFYRRVFEQPLRRTLLYLLYLSAFVALVLTLTYAWQYSSELKSLFQWARENLPPFEVKEGKLTVYAEQPLIRKYQGAWAATFVFDTTGSQLPAAGLEEPIFLFTEERLSLRHHGQTQSYRWKDFGTFRAGSQELRRWESVITWAYFPIAYSFLLLYTLVAKALLALFLILFGLFAGARENVRLPLRHYFTIAAYSLAPSVVIDLAVRMTGVVISYFPLIYFATAALYTYLATLKCVSLGEDGSN